MAQLTDILTLTDARSIIRKAPSNTQHVARLEALVSAISQRIDELVGPVVRRDVTGEQLEVCRAGDAVRLRRRPVASVSTVKVWSSGVATTLTAETLMTAGGYLAEKDPDDPTLLSGRLLPRSNWGGSYWAGSTMEVTYTAGRFADTAAAAGSRYWHAAATTLKSMWRSEELTVQLDDNDFYEPGAALPGFLIPNAAREFIADQIQYAGIA